MINVTNVEIQIVAYMIMGEVHHRASLVDVWHVSGDVGTVEVTEASIFKSIQERQWLFEWIRMHMCVVIGKDP